MPDEIVNSSYGILPFNNKVEIDRIESYDKENLILQLRVRNVSAKPVKIFSFVVAEFILPQIAEKVMEHGWLQCSEVSFKTLNEVTEENKFFLQRDQNHFSFKNLMNTKISNSNL